MVKLIIQKKKEKKKITPDIGKTKSSLFGKSSGVIP
jgi:hypothetical protein